MSVRWREPVGAWVRAGASVWCRGRVLARTAPACSSTQCGVPDEVVLVETPKAAVTATLPMTGVSAAELLADANLLLALRGGVAQSLGVNTSFVARPS